MKHELLFCPSLTRRERRRTVDVRAGGLVIGSSRPLAVQSMATADTNDTEKCVEQAVRIAEAGGQLVRFTAQGRREALNLGRIRAELRRRGYDIPLAADIHFNPEAALVAAGQVEKVRINPGNFVDKRASFIHIEYTDESYRKELERLETRFTELLDACRAHGTALRIGVNHGSLSDRILSRYGDTPAGMVESAMEFLRICRRQSFDRVVISMKSSNTQVMVRAYRLLAAAMDREDMHYPLHLGVTEAGEGEDGRIRSAVGIGALLGDGLGDTLRVSLTEPPEHEIPVARALADHYTGRNAGPALPDISPEGYEPYRYVRRRTRPVGEIGGDRPPVAVTVRSHPECFRISPEEVGTPEAPERYIACRLRDLTPAFLERLRSLPDTVLIAETDHPDGTAEQRAFFLTLVQHGLEHPVIVKRAYDEPSAESLRLKAAADTGVLFIDGFGDGLWIEDRRGVLDTEGLADLTLGILQAARVRMSRTEYISCPGCGRTLYDLAGTVRRIREKTAGFRGLKIAVMGCIVNGPGEMADADYGYVGSGPGRVTLYRRKEVIRRNIPQEEAVDELVALIREREGLA